MTWAQAMKQASRETVTRQALIDEENNKTDIEQWIDDIWNTLPPINRYHGLDFTKMNKLVSDMLDKALDNLRRRNIKYPYTQLYRAVRGLAGRRYTADDEKGRRVPVSVKEVNQLVFSSDDERFTAFEHYRLVGTGKIKSDWIRDFDRIAKALGVDPTAIPGYTDVRGKMI